MTEMLGMHDFKSDYGKLTVKWGGQKSAEFKFDVERLITKHYPHIKEDCEKWVATKDVK